MINMQTTAVFERQNKSLSNIAMLLLALLPMLHWYDIGLPIGLGEFLLTLLMILAIGLGQFKLSAYPKIFYVVWIYVAINWYCYDFYPDWKGILPGGVVFFIFAINVGVGIILFNMDVLRKYMRWIVIVAIVIFWFQFAMLHLGGTGHCFVPNLTGHFLYEDLTYPELVAKQLRSARPCAFFIEKSYMAYYMVIYLCIEFFHGNTKDILFSKLAIAIIVTLIMLQSGSGMVGMALLIVAKVLTFYWNKKTVRYLALLLAIPVLLFFFKLYVSTDIGFAMLDRQTELSTEGTSGYTRIVEGYLYYSSLNDVQKLFGTSYADLNNLTYLSYSNRNFSLNGIQYPLIQLGIVGLILWLLFYIYVFRKTSICGKMCVLVYIVLSALEVTYLGSYMVMLTIIPCSVLYKDRINAR